MYNKPGKKGMVMADKTEMTRQKPSTQPLRNFCNLPGLFLNNYPFALDHTPKMKKLFLSTQSLKKILFKQERNQSVNKYFFLEPFCPQKSCNIYFWFYYFDLINTKIILKQICIEPLNRIKILILSLVKLLLFQEVLYFTNYYFKLFYPNYS